VFESAFVLIGDASAARGETPCYQMLFGSTTAAIPTTSEWSAIGKDALNDGIVWGILVYIAMKPILRSVFAVRSRYEEHKSTWKLLMTLYNFFMCLVSLASSADVCPLL
jgi:hypothetical protein